MLLKSGHRFEIYSDYKDKEGSVKLSLTDFFSKENNKRTNIIYFYNIMTFSACDYGGNIRGDEDRFYFPTPLKIERLNGRDWYNN